MKSSEIAKTSKVSNMMVWYLINGKRKTTNILLAIEVARKTGKRPIDYINDKIKSLALEINPDLSKKLKKIASRKNI